MNKKACQTDLAIHRQPNAAPGLSPGSIMGGLDKQINGSSSRAGRKISFVLYYIHEDIFRYDPSITHYPNSDWE